MSIFHKKQAVAEFLFEYLYNRGVDTAFGIPGDFVLPTFRHLDQSKISIMTCTHEPSVGFAADCYARAKGLGLAVVTYCVGGLNMLNAVAGAYAEKSPLIIVSGGPSPKDRYKDPMVHHKVKTFETQARVFEEVTCASTVILDPDMAASEIVRVVEEVKRQSRPGYIELPFDIADALIDPFKQLRKYKPPLEESDKDVLEAFIEQAAKSINKSKKPVIVAGVELHRHGLTDLASDLAKLYNIPIAATLMGKSVVRETNPLYIGVYGGACSDPICQEYVESSDCVILIGAFLSDVLLGFGMTKLDRKKAINLNTEKAQIGLQSYDNVCFTDALEALTQAPIKSRGEFINPNPYTPPQKVIIDQSNQDDPITVEAMFNLLANYLEENHSIVCDTGDALVGALGLRTSVRGHFFSDAYYLSMGFAVPGALGVMAAFPESKTFIIVGDGAFQMTGMELSSMAKYGLKPVVIIINNDGYGTQRHIIDGTFNNIHPWDYTRITDVLGYGASIKATTMSTFNNALSYAQDHDEMVVIEVVVPRDDCSKPLQRMGELLGRVRDVNKH